MDRMERSSFDTSSLNASTSIVDSFPVISSSNDKCIFFLEYFIFIFQFFEKWMECVNALKIADAKLQLTLGKQMNIAAKMLPLISNFSTSDRQLEKYRTDCSTSKDIRKRKWNRATLLSREYFASDVDDDFPPNYKTKKMNEETLCSSTTVEDSFVEVSPFTIEASRADVRCSIDLERFQYILDALFLPDSESVVAVETEPKKPRPPILKLSTNSAMKQGKNATTEKSSESVKEVSFEFPAEEEEEMLVEDEEEGREFDENDTSTSDDSYSILSIDDSDINDPFESEDGSQQLIQSATVPVEKNDDLSFEGNESGRWLNKNNQPKMLQDDDVEQVILPRNKSNEIVIDDQQQMELVSQWKVESFTYDASVEDPFISDDEEEENENDQPFRFVETFVSSAQLKKHCSNENVRSDQSHSLSSAQLHGDVQSGMESGCLLSDDDEYSAGIVDEVENERLIRSRRFNPADAAAKKKSSSSALKYQIFVGGVEMERNFNSPLVGEQQPVVESSVSGDSDDDDDVVEKKSRAQIYSPPMTRARAKKSEKSKNNPHADDGN
ncbi:hypothetical protein T02_5608 [Trichinella nativa]|uniref:Uncharacterized protein n=2 Tax=Trichinella nativa TaxID=6335 RepID=A0A0V1L9V4_9BILA|nr:hypothetical protein T02_5608 [Trichinella nativa]